MSTNPAAAPPTSPTAGRDLSYVEGSAAMVLAPDMLVSDADSAKFVGAHVDIYDGTFANDGDVLTADTTGTAITADYNSVTQTLTLSGVDTVANYQAVLRTVSYRSTSSDPTNGGLDPIRSIFFFVDDGQWQVQVSGTYRIDITAANAPPSGVPNGVLAHGAEDTSYTVTTAELVAGLSDPNNDTLTVTNLAASVGAVRDNGDGTFTITTPLDFNGMVTLSYGVDDGHGGTLYGLVQTYTLDPVDDAPTFNQQPTSFNVAENTAGSFASLTASDIDSGALQFSIAGGADGGRFKIDTASGALSFVAPPDFEAPGDADGSNVYIVDVAVSDGTLHSTQTLTVTVTDVGGIVRGGMAASESTTGTPEADTLAGAAGNDTLVGAGGHDRLDGGAGADLLQGGVGDDTFVLRGSEGLADTIDGGSGEAAGDAVEVVGTAALTLSRFSARTSGIERWIGNDAGILGTIGNDVLDFSGLGNVVKLGAISVGAGNDSVIGSASADTVDGGAGRDTLAGGGGDDLYVVDMASDVVLEAAGGGADTVQAGVSFALAAGQDIEGLVLTGGAPINGTGNALANWLTGNGSANVLSGLGGDDRLSGAGGDDTLIGGAGADTLDGGDGIDAASYATSGSAVQADLEAGIGLGSDAEGDRLVGIEWLIGSAGADDLRGDAQANRIDGGAGRDTIEGRVGNDTLIGGAGIDTVSYEHALGGVIVYLAASAAQPTGGTSTGTDLLAAFENVTGSGFDDTLIGGADANVLYGLGGNDSLSGGAGADSLYGGDGDDTYVVDNAGDKVTELGGQGSDTVRASVSYTLGDNVEGLVLTGAAALAGTGNADGNSIAGNAAANALAGLGGNDTLAGGGGNDTLTGGAGDDLLTGGAGNDRFVFGLGCGADTITDFAAGAAMGDVIQLERRLGIASFADIASHASASGSDLRIGFADGSSLTLAGISSLAALNPNDFRFV